MRKNLKFILKNIETRVYLKYMKDINLKHYVCDSNEATKFSTKSECNKMLKKFKHPELWEIVGVEQHGKR